MQSMSIHCFHYSNNDISTWMIKGIIQYRAFWRIFCFRKIPGNHLGFGTFLKRKIYLGCVLSEISCSHISQKTCKWMLQANSLYHKTGSYKKVLLQTIYNFFKGTYKSISNTWPKFRKLLSPKSKLQCCKNIFNNILLCSNEIK